MFHEKQTLYGVCILMAALCACSQTPASTESTGNDVAFSVSPSLEQGASNDLRMLSSESEAGRYRTEETDQAGCLLILIMHRLWKCRCVLRRLAPTTGKAAPRTAPEALVTCPVFLNESSVAFIHTAEGSAPTIQSMPLGGESAVYCFLHKKEISLKPFCVPTTTCCILS